MTSVELQVREPSVHLINAIYEVTNGFQKTAAAIDEAFKIGREEGFSDKEIGKLIREQMLAAGFNDRSIRRALPLTAKQTEKTNKNNVTEEYADKMSASDSVNSGSELESPEQETNDFTSKGEEITPPIEPQEQELLDENKELRKALEETRKEVRILREINPEQTKNPEQTRQIKEALEKTLEENSQLKELVEMQTVKASNIPKSKNIQPFIIKKEQIGNLWKILGRCFNHDVQAFLCEESWLHVLPPFQSTDEVQHEYAQKFEELSQRNATQTQQEQETKTYS